MTSKFESSEQNRGARTAVANSPKAKLMHGETADMFADLMAVPADRSSPLEKTQPASEGMVVNGSTGANAIFKKKPVDHMAAARRLRWKLRNAQSHSPEEVKAGRLICRHLLAMLEEASPASQLTRPEPVVFNASSSHPAAPKNDSFYAVTSNRYQV